MSDPANRSDRLHRTIAELLVQAPEIEAAAVVSFDGLPMASALPATMDEDRVAAMSAALLSLGERAAEGLGRGALNQVYIEGEHGTVFLVSADDEAVLVAVAARGAKVGMMLYEVRRSAAAVAEALRHDDADAAAVLAQPVAPPAGYAEPVPSFEPLPSYAPVGHSPLDGPAPAPVEPVVETVTSYAPAGSEPAWPSYLPNGASAPAAEPTTWS